MVKKEAHYGWIKTTLLFINKQAHDGNPLLESKKENVPNLRSELKKYDREIPEKAIQLIKQCVKELPDLKYPNCECDSIYYNSIINSVILKNFDFLNQKAGNPALDKNQHYKEDENEDESEDESQPCCITN